MNLKFSRLPIIKNDRTPEFVLKQLKYDREKKRQRILKRILSRSVDMKKSLETSFDETNRSIELQN